MASRAPVAVITRPTVIGSDERRSFDDGIAKGDWFSTSKGILNSFKAAIDANARTPPQARVAQEDIVSEYFELGLEMAIKAAARSSVLFDRLMGVEIGLATAAMIYSMGKKEAAVRVEDESEQEQLAKQAARTSVIASVAREVLMKSVGMGGEWAANYYGMQDIKDSREKLMLRYKGIGLDIALQRAVLTLRFVEAVKKLGVDEKFNQYVMAKWNADFASLIAMVRWEAAKNTTAQNLLRPA